MLRPVLLALVLAACLAGQGTKPRANASAYEIQGSVGDVSIGAEYLVHSIPASTGYLIAEDYLVVEAALFGPRSGTIRLAPSDFQLRINGAVKALEAQPSGSVAYSIKDPGRLVAPQRAPGDPNSPAPPKLPGHVPTSVSNLPGYEKEAPPPVEQQVARAALPWGESKLPVSGTLFFPFKGKTTSIKSLELIYNGPAGPVTLKFF